MKFNVALIVLYDSEKRILLQHRSRDAEILAGYWAFFGGGINQGESPREAVQREAFEELRYRPRSPRLVLEQGFTEGDAEGLLYVFVEHFGGNKSLLSLQEGQGWGWYAEPDIAKLRMVERDRKIAGLVWRRLCDNDKTPGG